MRRFCGAKTEGSGERSRSKSRRSQDAGKSLSQTIRDGGTERKRLELAESGRNTSRCVVESGFWRLIGVRGFAAKRIFRHQDSLCYDLELGFSVGTARSDIQAVRNSWNDYGRVKLGPEVPTEDMCGRFTWLLVVFRSFNKSGVALFDVKKDGIIGRIIFYRRLREQREYFVSHSQV